MSTGTQLSKQSRYVVVDTLRGLAILGMIWAHVHGLAPRMLPEAITGAISQMSGAATPLFMLVAGTTIAILTRKPMEGKQRWHFRLEYFLRGVGLILIGLALLPWGGRVDVVLSYLGVTFILAVPFLFASSKVLSISAVAILAASPILASIIGQALITTPELLYAKVSNNPIAFLLQWTFTGRAYHATWLLPFLLLGIVAGRQLLAHKLPAKTIGLVGFGLTAGVFLLYVNPQQIAGHYVRGSYVEMTFDLARAMTVYGLCLWLAAVKNPKFSSGFKKISMPISLAGRIPLTLYVLHVLLLFTFESRGWTLSGPQGLWPLVVFVLCLGFAVLWGLTLGVGPVERFLGVFSLRHNMRWAFAAAPANLADFGFAPKNAQQPSPTLDPR
ncbi:acyltransferase family protein [Glutamicibacter sp.]|uniref:acyltransferase family protein n=1 Tax=Glutamicibacter sp. TaxID=1931995 RepID=UPI0028BD627A|nr:acyltransferase family protein [Glutamicibacter sp.]